MFIQIVTFKMNSNYKIKCRNLDQYKNIGQITILPNQKLKNKIKLLS
jgi:hypothetical protein